MVHFRHSHCHGSLRMTSARWKALHENRYFEAQITPSFFQPSSSVEKISEPETLGTHRSDYLQETDTYFRSDLNGCVILCSFVPISVTSRQNMGARIALVINKKQTTLKRLKGRPGWLNLHRLQPDNGHLDIHKVTG